MTADIEARVKLENEIAATITSRGHKAIKSYEVLPADLKDPKPPAVDALIENKGKWLWCGFHHLFIR